MSDFSFLVEANGNRHFMPDISYLTESPEEIIHPRIMYENGIPCVRYCKKDLITIQDFLTILASNKNDFRVSAYRSNGKGTTITFSKKNKITLSPRIKNIIEDLRNSKNVVSKKVEAIDVTEQVILENKFVDEKTLREIKTRRGQPEFRQSLLLIFKGKCCVTGCNVESVLEAAHIIPHSEESNYSVLNGLLLRADIHTLYDLNLIGIDGNGKVFVSETLRESEYWQYQNKIIDENIPPEMSANLSTRFKNFMDS